MERTTGISPGRAWNFHTLSGTILFLRLDVAWIQNSDSVTQTGNINDPTVLSRFPHHRK